MTPGDDSQDLLIADTARTSPGQTRLYRRMVRLMKYILVMGIVGVIVAIFLWPDMNKAGAPNQTPQKAASNELVNPTFEAVDNSNQPYTLKATKATARADNADLVDLQKPAGKITLNSGAGIVLNADSGVYQQNNQIMDLSGHVTVNDASGYTMSGDSVHIDMKTKNIHSRDPVTGKGPLGTLNATAFDGNGETGVLIFHGPATMTINQD